MSQGPFPPVIPEPRRPQWEPLRVTPEMRDEPGLLWRSIVQGFGFAIGFFLFGLVVFIVLMVLSAILVHSVSPMIPIMPGLPVP